MGAADNTELAAGDHSAIPKVPPVGRSRRLTCLQWENIPSSSGVEAPTRGEVDDELVIPPPIGLMKSMTLTTTLKITCSCKTCSMDSMLRISASAGGGRNFDSANGLWKERSRSYCSALMKRGLGMLGRSKTSRTSRFNLLQTEMLSSSRKPLLKWHKRRPPRGLRQLIMH